MDTHKLILRDRKNNIWVIHEILADGFYYPLNIQNLAFVLHVRSNFICLVCLKQVCGRYLNRYCLLLRHLF